MIFELDQKTSGDWDEFVLREIGLAVQRRMAANYRGSSKKMRDASVALLCKRLGKRLSDFSQSEKIPLSDFAVALSEYPGLNHWSQSDLQGLVKIIRAKAGPDEARYLKLTQRHKRLREVLIKMGSS
jgi:hypothetical protein